MARSPLFFHFNRIVIPALFVNPPGVGVFLSIVVSADITAIIAQADGQCRRKGQNSRYDDLFFDYGLEPSHFTVLEAQLIYVMFSAVPGQALAGIRHRCVNTEKGFFGGQMARSFSKPSQTEKDLKAIFDKFNYQFDGV